MTRIRDRVIKVLMILALGVLPGGGIECDLEDGELDIDFDGHDYCYDCGDWDYFEFWFDDYCYSCWW